MHWHFRPRVLPWNSPKRHFWSVGIGLMWICGHGPYGTSKDILVLSLQCVLGTGDSWVSGGYHSVCVSSLQKKVLRQVTFPWHTEFGCANFQELGKKGEDKMLEELAKKRWRRCPNCNYYVEIISGCNYIKCRSVNLHFSASSIIFCRLVNFLRGCFNRQPFFFIIIKRPH